MTDEKNPVMPASPYPSFPPPHTRHSRLPIPVIPALSGNLVGPCRASTNDTQSDFYQIPGQAGDDGVMDRDDGGYGPEMTGVMGTGANLAIAGRQFVGGFRLTHVQDSAQS